MVQKVSVGIHTAKSLPPCLPIQYWPSYSLHSNILMNRMLEEHLFSIDPTCGYLADIKRYLEKLLLLQGTIHG